MGLPYNGWSDLVRHGRDYCYYRARDGGILSAAPICLGCSEELPPSCVPYHAEEYGPTREDYWASCRPLCNRCHAMVHARLSVPNRWKRYLAQAADRAIDEREYPRSRSRSPYALTKKCAAMKDILDVSMPASAPEYLKSLSLEEYRGPWKVALLRVLGLDGNIIEVHDWKLYGANLEKLMIERPDIDIQTARSKLKNVRGFPVYKPLYFSKR